MLNQEEIDHIRASWRGYLGSDSFYNPSTGDYRPDVLLSLKRYNKFYDYRAGYDFACWLGFSTVMEYLLAIEKNADNVRQRIYFQYGVYNDDRLYHLEE